MSADRAATAVAEARRDVHEYFVLLAASNADQARAAVARMENAVRIHDAEIVRALHKARISTEYVGQLLDPRFSGATDEPA